MKTASLTEVKSQLSRYIRMVRDGETVRIFMRGVPVADIVPIGQQVVLGDDAERARLAELERRGVIAVGSGGLEPDLLSPGPAVRSDEPLATTIAQERDERV